MPSAEASSLANFFFEEIKKRNPKHVHGVNKASLKAAEKLLKVRSVQELHDLIEWVLDDKHFWSMAILSLDSLFKNIDKLERARKNAPQQILKKNADLAEQIYHYFQDKGYGASLDSYVLKICPYKNGQGGERHFSIKSPYFEEDVKKFMEANGFPWV